MKSFKNAVTIILIVSMTLTSQAFFTFSNGVNNVADNSNTETTTAFEEEPENDETLVVDENNESVETTAEEMTTEEMTTEEMTTEETTTEEMTTEETTTEEMTTEETTTEEAITEEMTTEETKAENTEVDETEVSEVDKVETKNELTAHNSNNELYGDGSDTTYTIHYVENLPEGFVLNCEWLTDDTTDDISKGIVIDYRESDNLSCTDGSIMRVKEWNTSPDGTGTHYDLGAYLTDPSFFTDRLLTLYAIWGRTILVVDRPRFYVYYCEGNLDAKNIAILPNFAGYDSFMSVVLNPINENIPQGKVVKGFYSIPTKYVHKNDGEDINDYYDRALNTIKDNYNPENPDYTITDLEQEWEVNWGLGKEDAIWAVVYGEREYTIKYVDKFFGTDLTEYFKNYDETLVNRGADNHLPNFSAIDHTAVIEDFEVKKFLYIKDDKELVEAEDGLEMPSENMTIYVEGNKGILPPEFKKIDKVEVVTDNAKVNYLVGEKLDVSGLVLKLVFEDETVKYVEYKKELSDFVQFSVDLTKGLTANMKSVVITFAGRQLTYNINVKKSDVPSGGGGNSSSGGGGGGASDPTKGPRGDLTKNPLYNFNLNTNNNIPNNKMLTNPILAVSLLSNAENVGRTDNNVYDINGNAGFGKWLKLQGTNNWYFIVGDTVNSNFIAGDWFRLEWKDGIGLYHFDSTGLMQTG